MRSVCKDDSGQTGKVSQVPISKTQLPYEMRQFMMIGFSGSLLAGRSPNVADSRFYTFYLLLFLGCGGG